MWHIYNGILFSLKKQKETLQFVTICMGFEDIKWDKSDRERQIPLWSHFYVESTKAKLMGFQMAI